MGLAESWLSFARTQADRLWRARTEVRGAHRSPSRTHCECYNQWIALGAFPILPAPIRSRGVAQPGRAPGSGPGGRRFKSSLPDHFKSTTSKIAGNLRTSKRIYIRVAGMGGAKKCAHT